MDSPIDLSHVPPLLGFGGYALPAAPVIAALHHPGWVVTSTLCLCTTASLSRPVVLPAELFFP
jgi:hypothetical protein